LPEILAGIKARKRDEGTDRMSVNDLLASTSAILPMTLLIVWACLLLLVDLGIPKDRKVITAFLAAIGLIASMVVVILRAGDTYAAFGGMVVTDGFANYLDMLFLASGLVAIVLTYDYLKRMDLQRGEFYILLLFSITGMMLMASAADLIIVFLALELLSIPLYVMAGFAVPKPESEEASLKYFLLGSFSTGILVYGTALVYGATGTTGLKSILEAIKPDMPGMLLLLIGAGMILIGLGFKVAVVPFHMWTPDVYQGSPTNVTAFMSIGAKAAGFAALLRIFILAFPTISASLTPILAVLAALTMILGNVVAIAQTNVKRLLAYSSIAQAGYILMAMVPYGNPEIAAQSVSAALFYLVAYAFTSFTAWSVVIMLERAEGKGLDLNDYAGLGRKYPVLGFAMTVAMLSFIGVPPTLGFVGKFFLFSTVIEGGFIGLALIGVLTSLVSAYYYLRVVVIMYMREGEPQVSRERWLYYTTAVMAVCTVVLSLFSMPLITWATNAVMQLL
jgi:NADH-quinone oxidoreductase subunit N